MFLENIIHIHIIHIEFALSVEYKIDAKPTTQQLNVWTGYSDHNSDSSGQSLKSSGSHWKINLMTEFIYVPI